MTALLRRLQPLVLAAALLAPAAALADPQWGYDLADELMSPFCPGRALSECPSPQATELREWILAQEEAGVPRAQVEAELYRVWGDELRQAPRAEGWGLVAYGVPAAVFAAGGLLVWTFLRRQRVRASPAGGPPPLAPVDPELERQVDEDLARF